jgi:hypothetical protein
VDSKNLVNSGGYFMGPKFIDINSISAKIGLIFGLQALARCQQFLPWMASPWFYSD